jgi:chemotaxis methyl-accepting protein methylase
VIGADDEAGFRALTGKIADERGFGTASYKSTVLRRRLAVRMRARGAADYDAYGRILDADPGEYERLIDALTINVTKVYRNPDTWDAVAAQVLPVLWKTGASMLGCWVAGCASGEEAYTLAALWHRFVTTRLTPARPADAGLSRVRIVASDIDRRSLEAAARGAYAPAAFAETPDPMRRRYFTTTAPGLESAVPELRALVGFERRDLLLDPPPDGPIHLITCRNVVIYFDRESQAGLMRRFHESLAPGGFLVLGKVETLLGPSRDLFEVVDQRQRIFRRA